MHGSEKETLETATDVDVPIDVSEDPVPLAQAAIANAQRAFDICYKPGAHEKTWATTESALVEALTAVDDCGSGITMQERQKLVDMINHVRSLRAIAGRELARGARLTCQACHALVPSSECRFVIGINGRPRLRCRSCRGELRAGQAQVSPIRETA
jgi:hypothetical protein